MIRMQRKMGTEKCERLRRGYDRKDFEEALRRYVPASEASAMLREAYVPPPPDAQAMDRGSDSD